MQLRIKCNGCGNTLNIMDSKTNPLNEIEVLVEPCHNIDCYDCGKCEVEQKLSAVKAAIE